MTVNVPVWRPARVGRKAICTTQAAAGSRDAPQVVDATSKPADADNLRSARRTVPLFVSVTACGVLADPTPMVGNVTDPGWAWTDPAAPPIPTRAAVAGSEEAEEETVKLPVTTPFSEGVKTTFVEQLAPAAKVDPQVF